MGNTVALCHAQILERIPNLLFVVNVTKVHLELVDEGIELKCAEQVRVLVAQ